MDTETDAVRLMADLEGLIFIAGEEGLSIIQMQLALQDKGREEISRTLEAIQKKYAQDGFGMELVCYGGRWKLVAKESVYPLAQRLYLKAPARSLSSAAMEVLALIAYRQPITRVQIDAVRGVGSDMTIKKLQARGLIEVCGHADAIGRPLLYQVTPAFMDCFGIESLDDLPKADFESETRILFDSVEG